MPQIIKIRNAVAATIMTLAMALTTATTINTVTVTPAEAGKVKIVKKGSKMVLKGIGRVGKKMARSKNKNVRKLGRGLAKGSRKGTKGINKASRGVNKAVRKTKLGRKIDNTRRNANRWKNKQINKAFRKNRGKAGRFAKDVLKAATDL
ncbi:MAG: hypothetical protein AAF903_01030 [Pseudomonadota bacterium]